MNLNMGYLEGALQKCSPYFNDRPSDEVSLLVIHGISLPPGEYGGSAIIDLFMGCLDCDQDPFFDQHLRGLQVSSHFLIRRDGALVQFVSTDQRAWHAGVSDFEGRAHCNDFSIGIELEGEDTVPYESVQYDVLVALTRALQQAYPLITKNRIVGHEHIAPGRKTDPGPAFDWSRYFKKLELLC